MGKMKTKNRKMRKTRSHKRRTRKGGAMDDIWYQVGDVKYRVRTGTFTGGQCLIAAITQEGKGRINYENSENLNSDKLLKACIENIYPLCGIIDPVLFKKEEKVPISKDNVNKYLQKLENKMSQFRDKYVKQVKQVKQTKNNDTIIKFMANHVFRLSNFMMHIINMVDIEYELYQPRDIVNLGTDFLYTSTNGGALDSQWTPMSDVWIRRRTGFTTGGPTLIVKKGSSENAYVDGMVYDLTNEDLIRKCEENTYKDCGIIDPSKVRSKFGKTIDAYIEEFIIRLETYKESYKSDFNKNEGTNSHNGTSSMVANHLFKLSNFIPYITHYRLDDLTPELYTELFKPVDAILNDNDQISRITQVVPTKPPSRIPLRIPVNVTSSQQRTPVNVTSSQPPSNNTPVQSYQHYNVNSAVEPSTYRQDYERQDYERQDYERPYDKPPDDELPDDKPQKESIFTTFKDSARKMLNPGEKTEFYSYS